MDFIITDYARKRMEQRKIKERENRLVVITTWLKEIENTKVGVFLESCEKV